MTDKLKLAEAELELAEAEAAARRARPEAPAEAAPAQPEDAERGLLDPKAPAGTALRSFGRGASYGFSPQLAGVAQAGQALGIGLGERALQAAGVPYFARAGAVEAGSELLGMRGARALRPDMPVSEMMLRAYAAGRNEARREIAAGQAENPVIGTATELTGAMMAPGPKGAPIARAGRFGKAAGRAVSGVETGAIMGAGYSPEDIVSETGEVDPSKLAGMARGVGLTAALGGVAAPVIGAVAEKGGAALSRWLEARANKAALNAVGLEAGIVNRLAQEGIEDVPEALSLGRRIRQEPGLITPFASPATVQQRAKGIAESWAPVQGEAVREAQTAAASAGVPFSFSRASAEAERALQGSAGILDPVQRETYRKALGNIEKIREVSAIPGSAPEGFNIANQMRQSLQRTTNWKADAPEAISAQQKVASAFRRSLEEQMGEVAPEALQAYQTANQKIALAKTIQDIGAGAPMRELARKDIGLRGTIAGSNVTNALMDSFGPVGAWAAGTGVALAESWGRQRLGSVGALLQGAMAPAVPGLVGGLAGPAGLRAAGAATRPESKEEKEARAAAAFVDGT